MVRNPRSIFQIGPENTKDWEVFDFNNAEASPFTLKTLSSGDLIREVAVKVDEVFDQGYEMTIGFDGNEDAILDNSMIDLQKLGTYIVFPFRFSQNSETLKAFFSGSSPNGGAGQIFLIQ